MDPVDLQLVIDSRARDARAYPSPSHYCVTLDTEVRDVCSISLAGLAMPDAMPTLPSSNAVFEAGLGHAPSMYSSVRLRSGSYATSADIAVEVGAALARDIGGDITVTADIDGRLNLVSPTSPFEIAFSGGLASGGLASGGLTSGGLTSGGLTSGGPARLLGFEPGGTYHASAVDAVGGGSKWVIEAPFCVDVRAFKRYLVVDIWHPQAEVLVSPSANLHRAFAIVKYPHSHKFPHSHISTEGVTSTAKVWSPPLPSLRRIGVSVRTADGTLADFQNQDHVLELKIKRTPVTSRFQ